MKHSIRQLAAWSVQREFVWRCLDGTVLRATRLLDDERRRIEAARRQDVRTSVVHDAITTVCPDLIVKHGPFRGMRYPFARSVYSALFPKLLGTYERELAPLLDRLWTRDYTEIVDVGCAEGYYAVGFALRFPKATVYAYDTDPEGVRLCRVLAEANGVADRVVTGSFCDLGTLASIPFRGRALILSDCEGYERRLLSRDALPLLAGHDVLVELHDFIDISISDQIRATFAASHEIEAMESIDDIKKARTYEYPELARFDLATRRVLLSEQRPAIMEWFLMTARQPAPPTA